MNAEKLNVKFKLIDPGSSKLALVKAIKFASGWGLKDSKDFVDSTDTKYQQQFSQNRTGRIGLMDLELTKAELDEFETQLRNCTGATFELNGTSKLRNRKLIELGLYDKDELIEELVEDDLFRVIKGDIDFVRNLLKDRYNQLPEEYIKEKLKNESNL